MKTLRCLALIFCCLSSGKSFASKARMEALGGESNIFYYVNDSRNIFYNPAYVNLVKDFMIVEWGKNHDQKEASSYAPKPEGGAIKMGDAFVYGIYLGNTEGHENRALAANGGTQYVLNQDNSFEVFLGGDAGMNWGASVKYSQSSDEESGFLKEQESLKMRFGILSGRLESFLQFGLYDKSKGGETTSEEFRNDLTFFGGINYFVDNLVFYFSGSTDGHEYKRAADGQLDRDYSYLGLKFGGGQTYQMDEGSKIFVDLHYYRERKKTRINMAQGSAAKSKTDLWRMPLTIGLESNVMTWLTLRGSITQNLLSKVTTSARKDKTERNTTNVNAGATIELGKVKIDGLIGMTDNTGASSKSGFLSTSNLLTRVSLSYWF